MTDLSPAETAPVAGQSALVTGGAGFVGSHIADALAGVCEVTVLDDLTTGESAAVSGAATLVRGDVRDPEAVHAAMADADVVFHQAGLVDVGRSVRAPVESHTRNTSGTLTVLEAARQTDTRVVVASSAAIYGPPESVPVHETDRKRPTSPYGVAKLAADQYARRYADLYGLPTATLRYFNVYGPRRAERSKPGGGAGGVVEAFVDRARSGDPLVVHGDGAQTRDFVHVSDVVRANVRAAVTDDTGRAFNVGTGQSVSVRDLARLVRRVTGTDSAVTRGPGRDGDVPRSRAEIGRARETLEYEPRVPLEEGLRSLAGEATPAEPSTDR